MIDLICGDCMEFMKKLPDKSFDLAIVDPPYGIGKNWNKNTLSKFYKKKMAYTNIAPGPEYFEELMRVSKNQIIWGGNYFTAYLPTTGAWLVWDKIVNASFRACVELAWTSLHIPAAILHYKWDGLMAKGKSGIHPHEKPVALYKWLLGSYAKPGWSILDTHLGSGSIAVACCDTGFNLTGCEINPEFFEAAQARLQEHQAQQELFGPMFMPMLQEALL
jgi:site-specific DNA-methyltransferase (adenine-specific)